QDRDANIVVDHDGFVLFSAQNQHDNSFCFCSAMRTSGKAPGSSVRTRAKKYRQCRHRVQ
ncbi:MAG TPA: hypothetical protein PK867_16610, partial [Pirellulales bacterium]|nr:hypothetical protein [Pirellulales bacterium]